MGNLEGQRRRRVSALCVPLAARRGLWLGNPEFQDALQRAGARKGNSLTRRFPVGVGDRVLNESRLILVFLQ